MPYQPITSSDIYGNNKQALFGQFGMDPKGNNESGRWGRQNQQLVGTGLTNANDFAVNQLEPARQNSLQSLIARAQAGNLQAQTMRNSQQMVNQGREAGGQAAQGAYARGLSPEYQASLQNAIMGNAQRNANQYIGEEDQRLAQLQSALQQMIRDNQQNPFLGQFISLAQLIEQRYQQNQQDKMQGGLGGLGSIIGNVLPMIGSFGGAGNPAIGMALQAALGGAGSGASSAVRY